MNPHIKMGGGRITVSVLHYVGRCHNLRVLSSSGSKEHCFDRNGNVNPNFQRDFYEVTKFRIDPMASETHRLIGIDGEPIEFAPLEVTIQNKELRMLSL